MNGILLIHSTSSLLLLQMFWQLQTINIHSINPESATPVKDWEFLFMGKRNRKGRKKQKEKKSKEKHKERLNDILFSTD